MYDFTRGSKTKRYSITYERLDPPYLKRTVVIVGYTAKNAVNRFNETFSGGRVRIVMVAETN